jgi:hypothetical protein
MQLQAGQWHPSVKNQLCCVVLLVGGITHGQALGLDVMDIHDT